MDTLAHLARGGPGSSRTGLRPCDGGQRRGAGDGGWGGV